jgi:hypothetical protein
MEALAATDAAALQTLADAIDRRLRKADIDVTPLAPDITRTPQPDIHRRTPP